MLPSFRIGDGVSIPLIELMLLMGVKGFMVSIELTMCNFVALSLLESSELTAVTGNAFGTTPLVFFLLIDNRGGGLLLAILLLASLSLSLDIRCDTFPAPLIGVAALPPGSGDTKVLEDGMVASTTGFRISVASRRFGRSAIRSAHHFLPENVATSSTVYPSLVRASNGAPYSAN